MVLMNSSLCYVPGDPRRSIVEMCKHVGQSSVGYFWNGEVVNVYMNANMNYVDFNECDTKVVITLVIITEKN